jgi:hypothetical protein
VAADLRAIREGRAIAVRPAAAAFHAPVPGAPVPLACGSGTDSGTDPEATRLLHEKEQAAAGASKLTGTAMGAGIAAKLPPAATPRRWGVPRRMIAAAAAVLLALAAAGFWLRSRPNQVPKEAQAPAGEPAATAPPVPVAPAPQEAKKSPAGKSAATPAALQPKVKEPAVSGSATLHIVCRHNFHSARLAILLDGQPLYETTLEGKKRFLRSVSGRLEAEQTVSAGRHSLRVRVTSDEDKFSGEAVVSGRFAADGKNTLQIGFSKPSGEQEATRKLVLTLQ